MDKVGAGHLGYVRDTKAETQIFTIVMLCVRSLSERWECRSSYGVLRVDLSRSKSWC